MSLSMYQASIPVFIRMLTNLSAILEKGSAFSEARKIDPAILVNDRLAPDMFTLARQVQIATDVVKGCAARLGEQEVPSFADTETTFSDLQARITKTIEFIKSISASSIDASAERTIILKIGSKDMVFKGQDYLLSFVLPNLYFHSSIAYAILRHNGVELGKMDFLGAIL